MLYCHSFQWAGTTYHKINITRRIIEFDVSSHTSPAVEMSTLLSVGLGLQNLRALSSLPAQALSPDLKADLQREHTIAHRLVRAQLTHCYFLQVVVRCTSR